MIEPKTYRKKPVHVKAIRFDGDNAETHAVYQWIEKNTQGSYDTNSLTDPTPGSGVSIDAATGQMVIATLEGEMKVSLGDYVIQGVAGEFYPCKPDIFAATYEEVDQDGRRVNSTQYPSSPKTPVMTVAAVIEWLEGEKEDLEADKKKVHQRFGPAFARQIGAGVSTIEGLIEKLTKGTFEQMDEAQHD